jgi:hypothetical protein
VKSPDHESLVESLPFFVEWWRESYDLLWRPSPRKRTGSNPKSDRFRNPLAEMQMATLISGWQSGIQGLACDSQRNRKALLISPTIGV